MVTRLWASVFCWLKVRQPTTITMLVNVPVPPGYFSWELELEPWWKNFSTSRPGSRSCWNLYPLPLPHASTAVTPPWSTSLAQNSALGSVEAGTPHRRPVTWATLELHPPPSWNPMAEPQQKTHTVSTPYAKVNPQNVLGSIITYLKWRPQL